MKSAIEFILYYIPFQFYIWNKKERFLTFVQIALILFFQVGLAVYIFLTDYSGMEISSVLYSPERRKNPMGVIIMAVLLLFPVCFYYLKRKSIRIHYLRYIREPKSIREQKRKKVNVFVWVVTPAVCLIEICLLNYFFNK